MPEVGSLNEEGKSPNIKEGKEKGHLKEEFGGTWLARSEEPTTLFFFF